MVVMQWSDNNYTADRGQQQSNTTGLAATWLWNLQLWTNATGCEHQVGKYSCVFVL
jgi:hypothetical protein